MAEKNLSSIAPERKNRDAQNQTHLCGCQAAEGGGVMTLDDAIEKLQALLDLAIAFAWVK
jgi:hypothetical protein